MSQKSPHERAFFYLIYYYYHRAYIARSHLFTSYPLVHTFFEYYFRANVARLIIFIYNRAHKERISH